MPLVAEVVLELACFFPLIRFQSTDFRKKTIQLSRPLSLTVCFLSTNNEESIWSNFQYTVNLIVSRAIVDQNNNILSANIKTEQKPGVELLPSS